jgi:flagellar M-ring protein FliF
MNPTIEQLKAQIRQLNERLSTSQKAGIGALAIILIGGIVFLSWYASRPEWGTLYNGLNDQDAGAIVTQLQERQIQYRVTNGGTTIQVPEDMVHETRLALAASGMSVGGIVGNELFDQDQFGVPADVIALNKRRALEGELAKSIMSYDDVKHARVHLALPEETMFVEDEQPATASVVVTMNGGANLNKRQVRGIVNLVAGAVPKLEAENVSVVDDRGKPLNQPGDEFGIAAATNFLDYQRDYERKLEKKALDQLERIVGRGNAKVVVTAKMDFSKKQSTEEIFDPEKQVVRSEETLNEVRENGGNRVGGQAGAAENDPAVAQGVIRVGDASNSTREKTVTNFEINKRVVSVQGRAAEVNNLSVSVIVDGSWQMPAADQVEEGQDENAEVYVPRTAEEMRKFEDIVGRAVGLNPEKDSLTVQNVRFHKEPTALADAAMNAAERQLLIEKLIRYGIILLVALLLIFMVFRPLVRWVTAPADEAEVLEEGELPPPEAAALPGEEIVAQLEEKEPSLLDKVRSASKDNPDLAASVVKYWLKHANV